MRPRTGTSISKGWNVRKIAEAIAAPGVDTRFWLSMGVVGTAGSDGEIDDANANAVVISAEGVEVDVVLLPSFDPVTCRVASGGPHSTVDSPIHPGDEVLVAIPEGIPGTPPVILGVMNSAADKLPTDPGDRKPLFRNDRYLVWCDGIPIDLRTSGARLEVKPDNSVVVTGGSVLLGGPSATEQVMHGTSFMGSTNEEVTALLAAFTTLAAATSVGPLSALNPGFTAVVQALTKYQQDAVAAGNWLSSTTKTK